MRKECDMLFQKLLIKIEETDSKVITPIEKFRSNVSEINIALQKLRLMITEHGFSSQQQEIEFFKISKPKIYGLLVYSHERYNFETARPILFTGLTKFYNEHLKYISRFFRQHEFLYQYYKMEATEMDALYFLRGKNPDGLINNDLPELDPSFSTIGDYLFSKFLGMERLQSKIIAEMQTPIPNVGSEIKSKKGRELRWSGDITNLIELLYGLVETKQFNDGDIDISDLVDVLEQVFHVNLSNYFRRFTTIKRRKNVSKTRFLDEMRNAVAKRIDDADAYVPAWAK